MTAHQADVEGGKSCARRGAGVPTPGDAMGALGRPPEKAAWESTAIYGGFYDGDDLPENPWTRCSVAAVTAEVRPCSQIAPSVVAGGDGECGGHGVASRRMQVLFVVLVARRHIAVTPVNEGGAARGMLVNLAAEWLRPPAVWAPAEVVAAEKAFMPALRSARGGYIPSTRWRHIVIPEDMSSVYARVYKRQLKHADVLARAAKVAAKKHGHVQPTATLLRRRLMAAVPGRVATAILYAGGGRDWPTPVVRRAGVCGMERGYGGNP